MAALTGNDKILKQLSEPFDPDKVKYRTQGGKQIPYISIDMTINRLNEVIGAGWSFTLTDTELLTLEGGKYLATVAGELSCLGKVAAGVGADIAADPDKVFKTALAEAIKKAGHQLGIGLELWDEGYREVVAQVQNATAAASAATAAGDDLKALQIEVAKKAIKAGVPQDKQAIADHFGFKLEDFNDETKLKAALAA